MAQKWTETVQITVENVGKKFNAEWVLRRVNCHFQAGEKYAFTGANGSGKSTLIQLLMGQLPVSEGTIRYRQEGVSRHVDDWYRLLVLAAPYLELIEEFTLTELVAFHRRFKPFKNGSGVDDLIAFARLTPARHKLVRHFSSGMKQRLRLALAFQTDVPVVFLDEPTSNLDQEGVEWYLENISGLTADQLVIIGSNQLHEYEFCGNVISMADYK